MHICAPMGLFQQNKSPNRIKPTVAINITMIGQIFGNHGQHDVFCFDGTIHSFMGIGAVCTSMWVSVFIFSLLGGYVLILSCTPRQ